MDNDNETDRLQKVLDQRRKRYEIIPNWVFSEGLCAEAKALVVDDRVPYWIWLAGTTLFVDVGGTVLAKLQWRHDELNAIIASMTRRKRLSYLMSNHGFRDVEIVRVVSYGPDLSVYFDPVESLKRPPVDVAGIDALLDSMFGKSDGTDIRYRTTSSATIMSRANSANWECMPFSDAVFILGSGDRFPFVALLNAVMNDGRYHMYDMIWGGTLIDVQDDFYSMSRYMGCVRPTGY